MGKFTKPGEDVWQVLEGVIKQISKLRKSTEFR